MGLTIISENPEFIQKAKDFYGSDGQKVRVVKNMEEAVKELHKELINWE